MPNRTLKESICTSESLAMVSAEAERLFYRLLVNCDDYGRFHGNPKVIRAECFPLRIEDFSVDDINGWLNELIKAGMIRLYANDKRRFLEVVSWREHNTPRAAKSKFPSVDECAAMRLHAPARTCAQPLGNALEHDIEVDIEVDNEVDTEVGIEVGRSAHTQTPENMNPIEDEVAQLEHWGPFTQDDRDWLEQALKDYPGIIAADVRDCGQYWTAKVKDHSKEWWKSRLRTWFKNKKKPTSDDPDKYVKGRFGKAVKR